MNYFAWALLLGGLSAASLPLGSLIGIRFKFTASQTSFLAAFGAGALLAALSVELVAPTTFELLDEGGAHSKRAFYNLIVGCILGGMLYIFLNKAVNAKGGFIRKTSTLLSYYKKQHRQDQHDFIEELSGISLFRQFPPEHINDLMKSLRVEAYKAGDVVMEQDDHSNDVGIIAHGEFEGYINKKKIADLSPDDIVIKLISTLLDQPIFGTVIAKTAATVFWMNKADLDRFRKISPTFNQIIADLSDSRMERLKDLTRANEQEALDWIEASKMAIRTDAKIPQAPFIQQAGKAHKHSPLAIWLGILLDGIPESLVIGAGMLGMLSAKLAEADAVTFVDVIPFTLIAGLFLSNFPEALSSSQNMLKSGMSKTNVFFLWFSLMIVTALGAGLGYLAAGQLSHEFLIGLEGLAAGAMLTMIAAAMIPEAVILGTGNLVGMSTLAGFLSAISFKLFE
jgi:zinc transporter ZupT